MIKEQASRPNPPSRRSAVLDARLPIPIEDRKFAAEPESMHRAFNRYKRKAREENGDAGLDAKDPLNIVIPEHLVDKIICDDIVQWPAGEGRIIAICTEFGLELLGGQKVEIGIDGTFQVSYSTLSDYKIIALVLKYSLIDCAEELFAALHRPCDPQPSGRASSLRLFARQTQGIILFNALVSDNIIQCFIGSLQAPL
jgi:hypothetical protein